MKSFYDKDDYTIEDVQSLIDNQVEESIYLDFKSSGSLEKTDRKRMEISKDVAAFANSDGGIIVYGIKEVGNVAFEFSFIDGDEFTKEWIETIINSYVQRRISDVKIYPIRVDGDIKKSVYIVKIPYSYDAPHQSKDNKYYKRYNFMSVPMEEYEIRQSYGRKENTNLIIGDIIHSVRQSSSIGGALRGVDVDLTFQVSNAGNRIEELYKLEVHIHSKVLRANTQYQSRMRDEGAFTIFSFANTSPLFQGETTSLATVVISLNSNNISLLLYPLTVNLYYSNGSKKRTFHVDNEIIVAGVAMKDWVWN